MKTKKEILKMNKEELDDYKWNDDLNIGKESCSDCFNCFNCSDCSYCSNCFNCFNCFHCSDCYNCSDCYFCRNIKDGKKHQYKICNVQLTKEEYEKKIKELRN